MSEFDSVCSFLHQNIKSVLECIDSKIKQNAIEIVIRLNSPLYIVCPNQVCFISRSGSVSTCAEADSYMVDALELQESVLRACGYSIYAHKDEIMSGFISLGNGSRMAISSNDCYIRDALYDLSSISAVRVRIAKQKLIRTDFLFQHSEIKSTLIIGPPASGKTTLLRNICKSLADGINGKYYNVCVVDERNEIYPSGMLRPACLDVLNGIQKAQGINRAVRLCNPEVIICDEIGTDEEAQTILQSLNSGVCFICSMHAKSMQELKMRNCFQMLWKNQVFDLIVFLDGPLHPGVIKEITDAKELCFV